MQRTKEIERNLMLGGIILLILLTFTAPATASAESELIDRIVAVVNEEIILLTELETRMRPYAHQVRSQGFDPEKEKELLFKLREEMLNRLVDEKLTDQQIKRNDIKVGEAEIDSTIERVKQANRFTDEDLRLFLEKEQMTMEQYRQSIEEQVLRSRLVNREVKSKIVITEEEILAYYEDHPELYAGKIAYRLRTILMRPPAYATEKEKQAVVEQMQQIRARVEAGESFADLARIYSQSPTAADGGDLGAIEKEILAAPIQAALNGLQPGETTAVLDTDQGLQLFYVASVEEIDGKSLESVKEEIRQKLFKEVVDRKFISWLEELRSQSHIKIIN
jgi:peptidyl-prolyl cis-trans isomerase SurA